MPETNRIEYKQDIFGNSFTRMIFRFEDDIKGSVKILNLIKEDCHITIQEIARRIELSPRAVEKQIFNFTLCCRLRRL